MASILEQLEILRRIAERGKAQAEDLEHRDGNYWWVHAEYIDLFVHMLDEIERTKKWLKG